MSVESTIINGPPTPFIFIKIWDPAVAEEWEYINNEAVSLLIHSINFDWYSSAVAGNRYVGLKMFVPGSTESFFVVIAPDPTIASTNYTFSFANFGSSWKYGNYNFVTIPKLPFVENWILRSYSGFKAGDYIKAITILAEVIAW